MILMILVHTALMIQHQIKFVMVILKDGTLILGISYTIFVVTLYIILDFVTRIIKIILKIRDYQYNQDPK